MEHDTINLDAQQPKAQEQPAQPMNLKLLTTKEACNLLSCNRATLYKWEKKGIISMVRISRKACRVRESDIIAIVNKGGIG